MLTARNFDTTGLRWYVIKCRPRQDYRALENLDRQRFSCYLPTLSVERMHHNRQVEIQEPLFPGYLFIRLDDINDNWYPIRSTRGVSQIVCANGHPLPVQEEIIEVIRKRLATSRSSVPCLQPGERVRITEGCFSGVEAVFVAKDGSQRVMLLMKILHQEQTLSFPAGAVRKCGDL
jgi:transcriptional antiterminator RfaH